MQTKTSFVVSLITLRLLCASSYEYYDCSNLEYNRCVKIADPLIREAHLIFPDNVEDIDSVCRTWNKFVDCLKRFTDECFSDEQRRKFNKAVSNPIESVHKMCMDRVYQEEYLQHASCIKRTITEAQHCGTHYSMLVEQVAQDDNVVISKATICCFQDRFRKCVERETRRFCDNGVDQGPALQFSTQIIDKALSFLHDQCYNYIPNSGDCASISSTELPERSKTVSSVPGEFYPWTSNSGASHQQSKDLNLPTSTPWIPYGSQGTSDTSMLDSTQTQVLGSRSRPASYGRSNSWLTTRTGTQHNAHLHGGKVPEDPSPSLDSSSDRLNTWRTRPDWVSTTQISSLPNSKTSYTGKGENENIAYSSTEIWYPAAVGNQLSNEEDEPNQQGLSYRKNDSHIQKGFSNFYAFLITMFYIVSFG